MDTHCSLEGCCVPCGTQYKGVLQNGEEVFFCSEEHQRQFEKNQINKNNETEKK